MSLQLAAKNDVDVGAAAVSGTACQYFIRGQSAAVYPQSVASAHLIVIASRDLAAGLSKPSQGSIVLC